ncbi:MAG TPA: sigma-70 family RNA polymerase sigma factor [Allocoleopsis sp.]
MYRYYPQQWISDRLVTQNLKLVHKVTHQAARKTSEPYEDLLQEGIYGLMRAIARFNVDEGTQFSTFAMPYIRGRISQYLRDKGNSIKTPRTLYELAPREQRVRHALQQELGRSPLDREVAERMDVEVSQIKELKEAKRNTGVVSLDLPVSDGDGRISLGEAIAATEQPEQSVWQLLDKLEPSDRAIFYAIYVEEKPKKHVAAALGRSTNWVSQRLQAGLSLLRETVTA